MKDFDYRKSIRLWTMPFATMPLFLCSFQCTDLLQMDEAGPKVVLVEEMDEPVWPVYSFSEHLPPTNIYFNVYDISKKGEIGVEYPENELEVSINEDCSRYYLSVSAKEDFSGNSSVNIVVADGKYRTELPIRIEFVRIVPDRNEITVSNVASNYSVSVDSNTDVTPRTFIDWIRVENNPDGVTISVKENTTGEMREDRVILYDIFNVITADIIVRQEP